jgi:hypothetical protein
MKEFKNFRDLILCSKTTSPDGVIRYLTPQYTGTDESGTSQIELKLKEKFFELQTFRVNSKMPKEQMLDIQALHGFDATRMMRDVLENGSESGTQKLVIQKISDLGRISFEKTWTPFQKKMNEWFGYIPKIKSDSGAQLAYEIILYSRKIAEKSRIRPGNFVIVGPSVLLKIEDSTLYTYANHVRIEQTSPASLINKGGILGNIAVFLDPHRSWDDRRITVGATTENNEEGLILMEMESVIEEISTVTAEMDQSTTFILTKRLALVETENAAVKYYTFEETEKIHNILTHLWKKWFRK